MALFMVHSMSWLTVAPIEDSSVSRFLRYAGMGYAMVHVTGYATVNILPRNVSWAFVVCHDMRHTV